MATINLGRIGFVNKGDYNALTAYKVNDIVKYTTGTYACKLAHTGQVPTETTYWQEWVDDNAVHKTGDETIEGVKTFSSSPIVPTPTTGTQATNKAYVDASIALKTIATGTATFNSTTNNINLTGIGIGVEIGDVIQISGAIDAKNNSEFTVEVITDANNIIVNQAHANKGTTKNVAARSGDTGVTVKLLSKWYNAPAGLGQDWVNVTASRSAGVSYLNPTGRTTKVTLIITQAAVINATAFFLLNGSTVQSYNGNYTGTIIISEIVKNNSTYRFDNITSSTIMLWSELR